MLVNRFILRSDAREIMRQALEDIKSLGNLESLIRSTRKKYVNKHHHIKVNILGLDVEYYLFYNFPSKKDDQELCGRCITIIDGMLFDKDPIMCNEVRDGIEIVISDLLASLSVFGVKNYLFFANERNANIEEEDVIKIEDNVDTDKFVILDGHKTPFLIERESLKRFDIEKIRQRFRILEEECLAEGGVGMGFKEISFDSLDEFKRNMGL